MRRGVHDGGVARRSDLHALAVTRPGLEALCADELAELGGSPGTPGPGIVGFTAPPRGVYAAARWSRTATRILVVADRFRARTFAQLEHGLAAVAWAAWVPVGATVEVRARSERARLYHTGAIAQRVEAAVADAVGGAVGAGEGPDERVDVRIDVRIADDLATVRVDAVGESLDRRGWRRDTAKAPLPPTVAAAALRTIGWDGTAPLLDPLCGSGTIPIEAVLIATGRPPTAGRPLALEAWPSFAPGTWASTAVTPVPPPPDPAGIWASDRDVGAVAATVENAGRAGVGGGVVVAEASLSDSPATLPHGLPHGWIVTNPPWGRRIDGAGDLRDLYAALGHLAGRLGWRLAVLTASDALAGQIRPALTRRWQTRIAGEDVTLWASPG